MRRKDSATDIAKIHRKRTSPEMDRLASGLSVRVLGVYTGGGLDQVSLTLLQYQRCHRDSVLRVELVQHDTFMLPATKRLPLVIAHRDAHLTTTSIARFNVLLGIMFCDGIKDFCAQHSTPLTTIDLVSAYTPAALTNTRNASNDVSIDSSFGWNKVISTETGLSTVFNFDIIENATPMPQLSYTNYVEKLLLRHPTKSRACLHIGELATISYIPPWADNSSRGTLARPCGPGSVLIDYAVRYCSSNARGEDHDGRTAQSGQVHQGVVDRFLSSHDYSRRQPSLTIAREMFGNHEAQHVVDECLFLNLSEADTIATITRITSHNIVTQYRRLLALFFPHGEKVDELFIAGPSARNSNIIDYLEEKLPQTLVKKPLEDVGVPGEAIEAVSLAHLAFEAVLNQATRNAPTPSRTATSAATFDTVEGQVIPGHGWDRLLEEVLRFSEGTRLNVASDVVYNTKLDTPKESARSVNELRN